MVIITSAEVAHTTRVTATLAGSQMLCFMCGGPNTDF